MDELEEFSQAPHVVNNCSISSSGPGTASNGHPPGGGGGGVGNSVAPAKMNGDAQTGKYKNHQHGKRNGYAMEKPMIGRDGGLNLMDDLGVLGTTDDEDDSEEIVINEFRRSNGGTRGEVKGQWRRGGKVTLNGGDFDDEVEFGEEVEDEEINNNEDYEHISLSDDGLEKRRNNNSNGKTGGGAMILGSDISTDLLNCDDNDSDLLILTTTPTNKDTSHRDNSFRLFVNT